MNLFVSCQIRKLIKWSFNTTNKLEWNCYQKRRMFDKTVMMKVRKLLFQLIAQIKLESKYTGDWNDKFEKVSYFDKLQEFEEDV